VPSPDSRRQTITWVLLPKGLSDDGGQLFFSVYVAPALVADEVGGAPTLADFPDWLDWPATLAGVELGVEFDLAGSSLTMGVPLTPDERSSDLWRALFPPDTKVTPYATPDDLASRPVMTFSASTVMDSLRRSYTRSVLDAVDDLPLIAPPAEGLVAPGDQPFADVFNALRDPANQFVVTPDDATFVEGLATLVATARDAGDGSGMVEVIPGGRGPAGEIARAMAFHRGPRTVSTSGDDDEAQRRAVRDSVDFHRTLTSLSEHPVLLRRLGLVFDIALEIGSTEPQSGVARLQATWEPALGRAPDGAADSPTVDRPLWVSWRLDPQATQPFAAASTGPPGILDVGPASGFAVEPVALDSATLNAVAMASTLPPGGDRTAPPALRSGGLMLLHDGHAQAVHAEMSAATDRARGIAPEDALRAEDLVRGYRIDVFDGGRGTWCSLHERQVDYRRAGQDVFAPVREEGAHHPTVTSPYVAPGTEPGPEAAVFLHEAFVRWDGWSLSVPRPGRSLPANLTEADLATPADMTERVANEALEPSGIQIDTSVAPGTLPRLRFGETYRMRVRTVDLAGNGLSKREADDLWALPALSGGEGGLTPAPVDLDTGEIRFLRFEPVPPPAIAKSNPTAESAYRLVVRSGLDADVVGEVDTTTADECQLFAPRGSVELAEWHRKLDDAIGSTDSARVRASYDLAARESGVLPPTGAPQIPYLPDPLAIGFAIADAPGMPQGITFLQAWDADPWHDPRPVRLRLLVNDEAFQPAPDYDDGTRTLTIKLDPARRLVVRLGSMLPAEPPLALLDWARQTQMFDEQQVQRIDIAVAASRHCMFSPWQELELVHAVQRPLRAPDLQAESVILRHPGDTSVQCTASLVPEPFSTGSLSLAARWTDFVDEPSQHMTLPVPGQPPPWTRRVDTVVGSVALEEPHLVQGVPPVFERTDLYFPGSTMPNLDFGDTKHRVVTFAATAVSRFAEHFPETLATQPDGLSRTGSSVDYIILSTGRPPAPVVLDVAPLLRRSTAPDDATVRVREGGWLRIYLARPWFVTGEGERLGIVVAHSVPDGPSQGVYDFTSLLGNDMAYPSPVPIGLHAEHILNADGGEEAVLQEVADRFPGDTGELTVLTFDPDFDEASQRWYVDVHVDIGETYFPMLRLVLVRYQRASVPGEGELAREHYAASPLVVTEPVPLLPERRLRVLPDVAGDLAPPDQHFVRVVLAGPTYRHDPSQDVPPLQGSAATVVARAQRHGHRPLTGTDDDWVTVNTFPFHRREEQGDWELSIPVPDLADADRLLVVEEDHTPQDPALPQDSATASRVVYAEVIDGPFSTLPIDDGTPDQPDQPVS